MSCVATGSSSAGRGADVLGQLLVRLPLSFLLQIENRQVASAGILRIDPRLLLCCNIDIVVRAISGHHRAIELVAPRPYLRGTYLCGSIRGSSRLPRCSPDTQSGTVPYGVNVNASTRSSAFSAHFIRSECHRCFVTQTETSQLPQALS